MYLINNISDIENQYQKYQKNIYFIVNKQFNSIKLAIILLSIIFRRIIIIPRVNQSTEFILHVIYGGTIMF